MKFWHMHFLQFQWTHKIVFITHEEWNSRKDSKWLASLDGQGLGFAPCIEGYINNFIILPWYPAWLLQPLLHQHMDSLYSDHSYWERQRDTERQRERMKREKTLLTWASSLSSLYKCIWLIFWGPNVTQKPKGPAGTQQCVKPGHGVLLVWPTLPCPELGTATEAAFHGSAPWHELCGCSIHVKGSWLHKHPHHLFSSIPAFLFTI